MPTGEKFPHVSVEVRDQSRPPPVPTEPEGLHQPIYFGFAPRGPVNTPIKGSGGRLQDVFGDDVFNSRSKYFKHPNLFAREAASVQEVRFVRLIDTVGDIAEGIPGAFKSGLVIEANLLQVPDIPQYEKDAPKGRYNRANDGTLIPKTGADATAAGIRLTWTAREWIQPKPLTILLH